MDDEEKKAKLAAAKKKLKQLKKNAALESSKVSNGLSNENSPIKKQHKQISKITNSSTDADAITSNHFQENHQQLHTVATEKLNIISRQVSDLAHNSSAYLNGEDNISSKTDYLEKQIQELAQLLEDKTKFANNLNFQLEETKKENHILRENIDIDRKTLEDKWKKDHAALKEQLQVHIQTIGILVAEKTELQSAHTQSLKAAENKHHEIEDLTFRLRTAKQRVVDLEKEASSLNKNSIKLENANKELTKELDKYKLDTFKNSKANEELKQHNLELQSKLQLRTNEFTKLEDEVYEIKGKYEMAQLHLQQFQNNEKPENINTKQIEKILTEKMELNTRVQQLEESLKVVQRERDNQVQQYKQLIEKYETQNKEIIEKIDEITTERDLEIKLRRELEESFEKLQFNTPVKTSKEEEEMQQFLENFNELNSQFESLRHAYNEIHSDNQQLSRLLEDRENKISELETFSKQLQESVASHGGLLETIQSDKTALSRATAQNKELKQQIFELQDQFVKMSTENMELTTQLHTEQHNLKEISSKTFSLEEERDNLKELINLKEEKLSDCLQRLALLEDQQSNMSMAQEQQQHIIIEGLHQKLHSSQDAIKILSNQNTELQNQILLSEQTAVSNDNASAQIDNLNFQLSQFEVERSNIMEQLTESQKIQNLLKEKLVEMQRNLSTSAAATINGNVVTKIQFEALQSSMFQLEEKYKRVMEDKISLMDLTDQQEHIILQLQGETDTIGEYVSLYQQQRTLLQRRAAEKDLSIFQMSHERTNLQRKLTQLQNLVKQLLEERQMESIGTTENNEKIIENHEVPKLENINGHEDDWPDYSEEEGEIIVESSHQLNASPSPKQKQNKTSGTARKIMHILNEIGESRDHNIMPCPHCHGQLIVV